MRYQPVPSGAIITSTFGPRWGTQHRGVDFGREGGSAGMPVFAAQAGTVVFAGAASGFGGPDPAGWVVIDHPAEAGAGTTVYGHIVREVNLGDRVQAGQRIGHVNPHTTTNGGVAPHLHFEVHPTVWKQGSQVDPLPWLEGCPHPDNNDNSKEVDLVHKTLFGVDVSEHQRGMNIAKAAQEAGLDFAIIRTSDGTHRDRVYRSHLQDAESAGLITAAYHYLRNPSEGSSIAAQVQASLEVMGDMRRPMWIDVETPAGVHVDHIRECKRLFEQAGVRVIGCYSYVPYWEHKIAPAEPDSHEFGQFWVAAYGANRAGDVQAIYPGNAHRQWAYPLGGQVPVLWQYSSEARFGSWRGGTSGVDVNAFRGSREQLQTLFYGTGDTGKDPDLFGKDQVQALHEIKLRTAETLREVRITLDQLVGWARDGEGLPRFTGWPQLGGRTLVDFLGAAGEKLGIPGCYDVKKGKNS